MVWRDTPVSSLLFVFKFLSVASFGSQKYPYFPIWFYLVVSYLQSPSQLQDYKN